MIEMLQIGNGTFTLNGMGFHLTFEIKTSKRGYFEGKRIVSIMVGRDNESDYQGIANLESDGTLRLWRKAEGCRKNPANGEPLTARQIEAVIRLILEHGKVGAVNGAEITKRFEVNNRSYELLTSVKCIRCNRKLTHPDSVKLGIGPECANMV
jgi:hypothetical protein